MSSFTHTLFLSFHFVLKMEHPYQIVSSSSICFPFLFFSLFLLCFISLYFILLSILQFQIYQYISHGFHEHSRSLIVIIIFFNIWQSLENVLQTFYLLLGNGWAFVSWVTIVNLREETLIHYSSQEQKKNQGFAIIILLLNCIQLRH